MAKKPRFDVLNVGVLAVLGIIVAVIALFSFTGQLDFLRTQIFSPPSEASAPASTGSCGPFRKAATVELATAADALQPCLSSAQRTCRAANKTFATAENIRFGEVYSAGAQDIHWDWVCY